MGCRSHTTLRALTLTCGLAVVSATASGQFATRANVKDVSANTVAGFNSAVTTTFEAPAPIVDRSTQQIGQNTLVAGIETNNDAEFEKLTLVEALGLVNSTQNAQRFGVRGGEDPGCQPGNTATRCQITSTENGLTMEVNPVADNFIPLANSSIGGGCISSAWSAILSGGGACSTPATNAASNLRVVYWDDSGTFGGTTGLPDTLIPLGNFGRVVGAMGTPTEFSTAFTSMTFPTGGLWDIAGGLPLTNYTFTHAPVAVTGGQCYWFEFFETDIAAIGAIETGCRIFAVYGDETVSGDDYAMQATVTDTPYTLGNQTDNDWSWCLDIDLDFASGSGINDGACLPDSEPPVNDLCEDALVIGSFGGEIIAGTTIESLAGDGNALACGTSPGGANGGVWYTYTRAMGQGDVEITLTMCSQTPPAADMAIAVYCGGCEKLYCVAGNDDGPCGLPPELVFCAEEGRTYHILVSNAGAFTGSSDFSMELIIGASCTPDATLCAPCEIDCPMDATVIETESCVVSAATQLNGGCADDGLDTQFEASLVDGDLVCGNLSTYMDDDGEGGMGNFRDIDSYTFDLAQASVVNWDAVAELPIIVQLIQAPRNVADDGFDCDNQTVSSGDAADRCFETASAQAVMPAGTHIALITSQLFANYPCADGETAYQAVLSVGELAVCPPGATIEQAVCGVTDPDPNGGCNEDPVVFGSVACGEVVCGLVATTGASRDIDWLQLDLSSVAVATNVQVSLSAQFDSILALYTPNDICVNFEQVGQDDGLAGDSYTESFCVDPAGANGIAPGIYTILITTADFDGFPCAPNNLGNEYILEVTCTEACDVVCPMGGIAENENCDPLAGINSGCADPIAGDLPQLALSVAPGDTVCGSAFAFLDNVAGTLQRDIDTFGANFASAGVGTWTVEPEFPAIIQLLETPIGGTCADQVVLDGAVVDACTIGSVSGAVDPANFTYAVNVLPLDFAGLSIDVAVCKDYVATLSFDTGGGACCVIYDCVIVSEEECEDLCGFFDGAAACVPGCCPCPFDFQTTGTPQVPFPDPDGGVDLADLQGYLSAWQAEQALGAGAGCFADMTTTGVGAGDPASGTKDGTTNLSDLNFFLRGWQNSQAAGAGQCWDDRTNSLFTVSWPCP